MQVVATAEPQLVFENKYGCLPVVEVDRLVGILTEVDFARYMAPGEQGRAPRRGEKSAGAEDGLGSGRGRLDSERVTRDLREPADQVLRHGKFALAVAGQ